MPVIDPEHLLDQADRLAQATTDRAPTDADLRRAVSAVYYALFHAVLTALADQFVGSSQRTSELYRATYRTVDHAALNKLCRIVRTAPLAEKYRKLAPRAGFDGNLTNFAEYFDSLYQKRLAADYDPLYHPTRTDVASVIRDGRSALEQFHSADSASRRTFLTLLAFPPR